nr:hypothetical protein [Cohnella thermotolerans]
MGEVPQKINYHLKSQEKVGLVRRCGTRQVKNLIEVLYRAVARTYVIPDSFGWSDELTRRMKDQGALRQLLNVSDRIRQDALRLMDASDAEEVVRRAQRASVRHRHSRPEHPQDARPPQPDSRRAYRPAAGEHRECSQGANLRAVFLRRGIIDVVSPHYV